ncbi:hypothetical protein PG994_012755 [Apiospora phragmitis]|uniref:Uncharacterized protein n=1 Tax=Apiospora phragmitis TaxID=2905665 RepID=A0ABR1TBD3_9PEZI
MDPNIMDIDDTSSSSPQPVADNPVSRQPHPQMGLESSIPATEAPPTCEQSDQEPCGVVNLDVTYSMLRYISICWRRHLWLSLGERLRMKASDPNAVSEHAGYSFHDPVSEESSDVRVPPWVPYLSRFLLSRPNVTNWVFSSYRYNLEPVIPDLVKAIALMSHNYGQATPAGRELHWVVQGLNQLSNTLGQVKDDYGLIMRQNPDAIWQRAIMEATDPDSWPVWSEKEGARVATIDYSLGTQEPFRLGQLRSGREPGEVHSSFHEPSLGF